MGEEQTAIVQASPKPSMARSSQGVVLNSFEEAWRFSTLLAKSDLVPKDYKDKPENVMVAIQMGAEIGLPPMQAIQNIAVINGRPSVWGDVALALVQGSSQYEWHKEWAEGEAINRVAIFQIKRKGHDMYETRFSMGDAKTAGLVGKTGPWTNYPNRMLQMRARSWGLRDKFADVLRGVSVAEEAMDAPPVIVNQLDQAALPAAGDPESELRAQADKLLSEQQPQYNKAQRIVLIGRYKGHVQDLIDSLTKGANAGEAVQAAEKEQPSNKQAPAPESESSTEANAHGLVIGDQDFPEGMFQQESEREHPREHKGPVVDESKRTQNATRKPSSGSFGF